MIQYRITTDGKRYRIEEGTPDGSWSTFATEDCPLGPPVVWETRFRIVARLWLRALTKQESKRVKKQSAKWEPVDEFARAPEDMAH